MQDEDRVFDVIEAMENTTNHLNELVATLPGVVVSAVGSELRRTADFDRLARVVADTNTAAADLRRFSRYALIATAIACLSLPSVTWVLAYWQTGKLRAEAEELETWIAEREERIAALSATVRELEDKTGGGVELVTYGDGTRGVFLPAGSEIIRSGKIPDGRAAVVY